jgi:SSS family solute:Na+ symporter
MNLLHTADYIIIVIFLVSTLCFGLKFSKSQNTTKNYFLAKGRVPSWALGVSLLATLISSVTFLAYPGTGYSSNWILLVQGLMVPIVLLGVIWFIVPIYRKVINLSTYEYFERRFGSFVRYYSSIAFVLRQFSGMGTVFFLLAVALNSMVPVNTLLIILLVGALIIIINLLGGIEAVIWLDVFQGFMLFASGIICFGVLLYKTDGGLMQIWDVASANGRTGFGPYDWDLTKLTFLVMVINGAFYAVQKYGTDQTVVQRYLTAKTDKAAIRASLLGILLTVPAWVLFMFIGTALFVFYKQNPLPEGMRADAVFPYFIMSQLPQGVVGIIISAMVAAAVCSLSADLNSLAAVGVEDYYKRIKKGQTDKHYLKASKWVVLISGLISMAIAVLYVNAGNEGVLGIVFTLYAIFSGGIVGIFLLGLLVPRANNQGVKISVFVCILFTAYAVLTSIEIGVEKSRSPKVHCSIYN